MSSPSPSPIFAQHVLATLRTFEPTAHHLDLRGHDLDDLRAAFALLTLLEDRILAAFAARETAPLDDDELDILIEVEAPDPARPTEQSPSLLIHLLSCAHALDISTLTPDELRTVLPILDDLRTAGLRALESAEPSINP